MKVSITKLRIANFRGVKSGEIRLGPHTVFVGPNNSGKTTVIEALALLFGRDRLIRDLTEHDFFGGNPTASSRFTLIATLTGLESDDPNENTDWFRNDRAVPKWQDLETGAVHAQREKADWCLACEIGFCARFDGPSLEVETCRYFHDSDTLVDVFADPSLCQIVPSKLLKDIGFFLVPASRTWDRMISFSSELFRRVLTSGDGFPSQAVLLERDRLRSPQAPLEKDKNLTQTVTHLNEELAGFFVTHPELHLRVTSTDSDGVLDAVVAHYSHRGAGIALPARRQGSGLISLQSLFLLLQFGRRRAEEGKGFWMAVEEPELHIPPPLQRRLVQRLQSLSTRTFVSTHSPTVATLSNPESVVLLKNQNGVLSSASLQAGLVNAATVHGIRKLFQISRQDTIAALMHDVVLIPEGKTDFELLGLLLRAVDTHQSWSTIEHRSFGAHVGIIPTHDGSVVATYKHLRSLHPQVMCLVDGDSAGDAYIATLTAVAARPSRILRWPDKWTIEDVIGWIIEANADEVLKALAENDIKIENTSTLVSCLKSKDRTVGGLKQDTRAYEIIIWALGCSSGCVKRARDLLNAITSSLLGVEEPYFVATSSGQVHVRVFQP